MVNEKAQAELTLLHEEQSKAKRDEVFGGMSKVERAAFNSREERIQVLEREFPRAASLE